MTTAFFHIACMGHYREVVAEIVKEAHRSGLSEAVDELHVYICSGDDEYKNEVGELLQEFPISKSVKLFSHDTVADFEYPTLEALYQYCKAHPADRVLYIHSKGVSHDTTLHKYWRRAMMKYILTEWRKCIPLLDTHDTVGYNWKGDHYSGNWWWANAAIITRFEGFAALRKNPLQFTDEVKLAQPDRMQCEFFWWRIPDVRAASVGIRMPYDGFSIDPSLSIDDFDKDPFDTAGIALDARYCINLDTRPDKWQHTIIQMKFAGIRDVRKFAGVPARAMKISPDAKYKQICSAGVGCVLSHWMIISQAYHAGYGHILVMEDDVTFVKGFQEMFPDLYRYVPADYDILWVGGYERGTAENNWRHRPSNNWVHRINDFQGVVRPNDVWGTHCYILSRSGIEKAYRYLSTHPIEYHIDILLMRHVPDFIQYAFRQPLANQQGLKSDIQN